MHIQSSSLHSSDSKNEIERLTASEHADSLAEDLDEIKKRKKRRQSLKEKKKQASKQVSALSVIERETSSIDLMKNMLGKMADKEDLLRSKHRRSKRDADLKSSLKSYFEGNAASSSQDQVTLSRSASAYAAPSLQQDKKQLEAQQKTTGSLTSKEREASSSTSASTSSSQSSSVTVQAASQNLQLKENMKRFAFQYAQSLVHDPSSKKSSTQQAQLARTETSLLQQGLPTARLTDLKQYVSKTVRRDLRDQVKQSFLSLALQYSKEKISLSMLQSSEHYSKLKAFIDERNDIDSDHLIKEAKSEARSELHSFIINELDQALIEKKIQNQPIQEIINTFNRFNDLASISRFNPAQFMKTFQKKIDDLGLNYYESDDRIILDTDDHSKGDSPSQNPDDSSSRNPLLEDDIRSLYMQKAIHKDLKSQVQIQLKLKKFKRAYKDQDSDTPSLETLEKEGIALATLRLTDLLRESFEERASLAVLQGPVYQLVQKKFKFALKGLRRLGEALPKHHLVLLRDQANKGMFSIVKEEFLKIEALLKTSPKETRLLQQHQTYLKLLERLKSESDIQEDIRPTFLQSSTFSSETSIIEAV